MDTKQIEYILKIAEENNITKAADKLFITQSALNQQLLKLESELGTPLFHRSRTNWRPTAAGEIYIRNAREILRLKKNTYNQINDIANTKRGNLSIGFTPGRGINMFTSIYPVFHQKSEDGHPLRGWFYASFREGVQDFLSGETIGLHRINGTLGLDLLLSCNNYNFNFDTKLYHLLLLCK